MLITAGPTREAIDPVRYISNHSSGKMGYALAQAALARGCDTTLISGPVALDPPAGAKLIRVESTQEMCDQVLAEFETTDCLIMAAAPADYQPEERAGSKIKKSQDGLTLHLKATPDILVEVAKIHRSGQLVIGFALETDNAVENAGKKMAAKNLDLIVVNSPSETTGFDSDTNQVTLISRDGKVEAWELMKKEKIATKLLDRLLKKL